MHFKAVVTPTPITLEEFQDFIRSLGAEWVESGTPQEEDGHGYLAPLDKDPAKVYLHLNRDLDLDFSQKDMEDLTEIFGSEPLVEILIGVGSGFESYDLAEDVAKDIIPRFGGVFDYVSKYVE